MNDVGWDFVGQVFILFGQGLPEEGGTNYRGKP